MEQPGWEDVSRRTFELYYQGNYREALDLISREGPRFPEEANMVYYFKVCLSSVAGDTEAALSALKEAVDQGIWYAVSNLRQDTDLGPLQGLPEFERLVEICRERSAAAQAAAMPTRLTLRPEAAAEATPAAASPLLITLHGNGGNARGSADHWRPAVRDGWTVVLPQSSQVWGADSYVWNDLDWGEREVRQHLAEIRQEFPVDPARTVLAGFSMGGGLATWMALGRAIDARGFLVVGPFLNDLGPLRQRVAEIQPTGLRGYIIVGEEDRSFSKSQEIAAIMRGRGLACELEVHPGMGHEFPQDFEQSLRKGLAFILGD